MLLFPIGLSADQRKAQAKPNTSHEDLAKGPVTAPRAMGRPEGPSYRTGSNPNSGRWA